MLLQVCRSSLRVGSLSAVVHRVTETFCTTFKDRARILIAFVSRRSFGVSRSSGYYFYEDELSVGERVDRRNDALAWTDAAPYQTGEWIRATRVEHLGVIVDTVLMKFYVAGMKIDKARAMEKDIIDQEKRVGDGFQRPCCRRLQGPVLR
jgi:hypothetical protein